MATSSYTMTEVAQHKGPSSYWFVVHDTVYDVTSFLDDHPGGRDIIKWNSGMDATENFVKNGHSPNAKKMMTKYAIGELVDSEKKYKHLNKAASAVHVALPDTKPDGSPLPTITLSEVKAKTSSTTGMYIVVNNRVLDVTKFGGEHPGGPEIIAAHAGTDATTAFVNKGHSVGAVKSMSRLVIGMLPAEEQAAATSRKINGSQHTGCSAKSVVAAKRRRLLSQFIVWQATMVGILATVIYDIRRIRMSQQR